MASVLSSCLTRSVTPLQVDLTRHESHALIEEWLDSPEFADRVVRLHRDLLWNNVSTQRLLNNRALLTRTRDADGQLVYWSRSRALTYRGGSAPVGCLTEPVSHNADGSIRTVEVDGALREGPANQTRILSIPRARREASSSSAQMARLAQTGFQRASVRFNQLASSRSGKSVR